ncbi:MAG: EFR1 family ferrodoxin [Brotaphodocola sp.]
MNYRQVTSIYFSPTESTKKVVEMVAAEFPGAHESLDLTEAAGFRPDYTFREDEVVLVGVPVYAGRIPVTSIERFRRLHGHQTPAVLVVVYGNRAYDDALLELKNIMIEQGFRPAAGIAAVAEHNIARCVASGRPDEKDKAQLKKFGQDAVKRLDAVKSNYELPELVVKGNYPYKVPGSSPMRIKVSSACNACGKCIRSCPVQAISRTDARVTDEERCIHCMRCVMVCPTGARKLGTLMQLAVNQKMKKACAGRKEPEFF